MYTWFDQSFVHDVVQKLSIEWYRKTKDKIEAYIFNDVHVKFPQKLSILMFVYRKSFFAL